MLNIIPHSVPRRGSVLFWVAAVVVIGGMLVAVLLPSLCRAREPANRVKCASNLRQIGQAILMYAADNKGLYPPSLTAVLTTQDIGAEVFTCPSSNAVKADGKNPAAIAAEFSAAETKTPNHKDCLSYIYLGQSLTTETATDKIIVAYELFENHDRDGTNVLFGDGRVEFLNKKEWDTLAAPLNLPLFKLPTARPQSHLSSLFPPQQPQRIQHHHDGRPLM